MHRLTTQPASHTSSRAFANYEDETQLALPRAQPKQHERALESPCGASDYVSAPVMLATANFRRFAESQPVELANL